MIKFLNNRWHVCMGLCDIEQKVNSEQLSVFLTSVYL